MKPRLATAALGLAVIALLGCGDGGGVPEPTQVAGGDEPAAVFADSALAAAVGAALLRAAVAPESLAALSAQGLGIADLSGIEALVGLETLNLSGNRIDDLSALAGLTRLTFLDLSGNRVRDLTPLKGLTGLKALALENNLVADAEALLELQELRAVDLSGNPLDGADLPALADLRARGVAVAFPVPEAPEVEPEPAPSVHWEFAFLAGAPYNQRGLYLGATDGAEAQLLFDERGIDAFAWLDGTRMLLSSSHEDALHQFSRVYAGDVGARSLEALTPAFGGRFDLRWSPDGTQAVYAASYGVDDVDGSKSRLNLMTVAANGVRRLTDARVVDSYPTWSPDGRRIAFKRAEPVVWGLDTVIPETAQILTVDVTTGEETLVAESPSFWVSSLGWSPDGERLVYETGGDIAVVDSRGGAPLYLAEGDAGDRDPTWSPDGTRIAYSSRSEGGNDLYVVDADGTERERLTQDAADDRFPSFSPDGGAIVFLSDREGLVGICVLDLATGRLTNATRGQPTVDLLTFELSWRPK